MFISDFFRGLGAYFRATGVLFRFRLWPYLFLPGFLSFFLVIGLVWFGIGIFPEFSDYITANWMPAALQNNVVDFFATVLLWLLLLVLGAFVYKHVILILFAPVLGQLSEIVEKRISGRPAPSFSAKQLVKDFGRGVRINLRNLVWSLGLTILAWLTIFIPVAGAIFSPVALYYIQAYYGGFGFVDYILERRRFSVQDSLTFARRHAGLLTGIGTGFILLLLVPVVGWFAAPTYGTIAGTLAAIEKLEPAKEEA